MCLHPLDQSLILDEVHVLHNILMAGPLFISGEILQLIAAIQSQAIDAKFKSSFPHTDFNGASGPMPQRVFWSLVKLWLDRASVPAQVPNKAGHAR